MLIAKRGTDSVRGRLRSDRVWAGGLVQHPGHVLQAREFEDPVLRENCRWISHGNNQPEENRALIKFMER